MSNLVPEQRLDKNNRLVTRHVRPGGTSSATKHFAPAPQIRTDTQVMALSALKALADNAQGEYSRLAKSAIAGYEGSTLEIIGNYHRNVAPLRLSDIYYVIGEGDELTVREYYMYMADARESKDDVLTINRCINGVRYHYPSEELPDLTAVSPDRQQLFRSLIRVSSVIHSWLEEDHPAAEQEHDSEGRIINVIGDKSLVELIQQHPSRGDDIANHILTREHINTDDIREMLETVPRPMAEGFL